MNIERNKNARPYVSPYQNGRYVSPYQSNNTGSNVNNFNSTRPSENTELVLMRSTGRYKSLKYWSILVILSCMISCLVITMKVNNEHSSILKAQEDLKETCKDVETKCFIIENEEQHGGTVFFVFSIFLFIVYMTASVPKQYFLIYKYAIKIYFDLIPFMATYDIVTLNLLKKEINEQDCDCDNDAAYVFMVAMIWIFLASMVVLLINMCIKRCCCSTMKLSYSFYITSFCLYVLALCLNTDKHSSGEIQNLGILFSAFGTNTTAFMLCSKYETPPPNDDDKEEEEGQPNSSESQHILIELPPTSSNNNVQQNQISFGGVNQTNKPPSYNNTDKASTINQEKYHNNTTSSSDNVQQNQISFGGVNQTNKPPSYNNTDKASTINDEEKYNNATSSNDNVQQNQISFGGVNQTNKPPSYNNTDKASTINDEEKYYNNATSSNDNVQQNQISFGGVNQTNKPPSYNNTDKASTINDEEKYYNNATSSNDNVQQNQINFGGVNQTNKPPSYNNTNKASTINDEEKYNNATSSNDNVQQNQTIVHQNSKPPSNNNPSNVSTVIDEEKYDDFIENSDSVSKDVALINPTALRDYSMYLRQSLMIKLALKRFTEEWMRVRAKEMRELYNSKQSAQSSKLQANFEVDTARVGMMGYIKKGRVSLFGRMRSDMLRVIAKHRGPKFLTQVELSSCVGLGVGATYRIGKTNFYISGRLNFANSGFSVSYSTEKAHMTTGLSISYGLLPMIELGFGRSIDIKLGKLINKRLQFGLHTLNLYPVGKTHRWTDIPEEQKQTFIKNPLVQEKFMQYRKEMEDLQKLNIAVHELCDIYDILATHTLAKSIVKTSHNKVPIYVDDNDDESPDIYITNEVSNQMLQQTLMKEFQSNNLQLPEDELSLPVKYHDLNDFRRYRTDTSQEYLRNQERIHHFRNHPVVHSNNNNNNNNNNDDTVSSSIGTTIWEYIKAAALGAVGVGPAGAIAAVVAKGIKDISAFISGELGEQFEIDALKIVSDTIKNPFKKISELDVIKNNEVYTTLVKKLEIVVENLGAGNMAVHLLNKALYKQMNEASVHVLEEEARNAIVGTLTEVGVKKISDKYISELIPEHIKKKLADNNVDWKKIVNDIITNPQQTSNILAKAAQESIDARLDYGKEKLLEIYNHEKELLIKELEKKYPELSNVLKKVNNASVLVDLASGKIGKDDIANDLLEYERAHYKDVNDKVLENAQHIFNKTSNTSIEKLELISKVLENTEIQNIMKQKKFIASELTLLSDSFLNDIKDGKLKQNELADRIVTEIESNKAPIAKRSSIDAERDLPYKFKEEIMPARRAPINNINEQILPARRAPKEMPKFEHELDERFPIDDMFDDSWDHIA